MSRRLNRLEFDNTLRDLFGLDFRLGDRLPADGAGGEGFDNNGDALFTSAIHIEKYLAVAETIARTLLKTGKPSELKFTPEQLAAARKRFFIVPRTDRNAAKALLSSFMARAYRRPVDGAEVERLLVLFDKAQKRGDSFELALKLPLKAVLISPNFHFLIEPEPAKEGVYKLGSYPLASRLSYLLWASMPDEELLQVASKGELENEKILLEQTRRMVKDPKARGLAESFVPQWLGLRPLGETIRPDAKKFPEFDDSLCEAMKQEPIALFAHIFRENRSVLELLNADYTFVNERLAKHYGIEGVKGDMMRKVALKDTSRGGVLSMAGPLTVTSYPLRTSPVLRGKWVLEDLLGAKVPPAPPNAGELPADGKNAKGLSLRQQLELHRTRADCASCHRRMDPLGFGLDTFDPLGRLRTTIDGAKVDARGELPTGEKFDGPAELKKVMLNKRHEFVRNLSRKLLGYAIGRQLYRFDQCVIDDTIKALEKDEWRANNIIERIVLSYPFRHRYVKK
jgi:hypothetical protein